MAAYRAITLVVVLMAVGSMARSAPQAAPEIMSLDEVSLVELATELPTQTDKSVRSGKRQAGGVVTLLDEGAGNASTPVATMLKSAIEKEEYTTLMEGASSESTCGDGKREGLEECDDGNTTPNDGCNAVCKVEGGYQCLPEQAGGKDGCTPCGDTQCTTFFGRQSRCLDTIATRENGVANEAKQEPPRVGARAEEAEENNAPALTLLQLKLGGEGAYARGATGFCECSTQWCRLSEGPGPADFTCRSTSKGWARTSVADPTCTCGTGFCSMPLGGADEGASHCVPLHANMIRNNATGECQCRPATKAVNSTDPMLAQLEQPAACKILPVEPVVKVQGGSDKFGKFECVGAPYVKDANSDACEDCASTGACKVPRTQGTGNFLCFTVTNSSSEKSGPYQRKADGTCECGVDQCLKPKGDHFVCRDLTGAAPYGPTKHSDGMCGCSASKDVCRLTVSNGFRCIHMSKDNFAQGYRRAHDGSCQCKFGMCQGPPDPTTGRLVCNSAMPDSPYLRKKDSLQCECKPGACMFPEGVCKKCPTIPGQCESHCANATGTEISCTKFCRTAGIIRQKARATAQGQLQSVTEVVAREVGCFVEKVTKCTVSANSKTCTQKKSAKALYDCPAMKSGKVPLRLSDGTETYGYRSMCEEKDLECQIQNCGRNPDSQKCMTQAMLV